MFGIYGAQIKKKVIDNHNNNGIVIIINDLLKLLGEFNNLAV